MGFSYLGFLVMVCCLQLVVLVSGSTKNLPIINFDEGYTHLFGEDNLAVVRDGKSVHLSLDERTGSGFVSQDLYLHGFFSASNKLPAEKRDTISGSTPQKITINTAFSGLILRSYFMSTMFPLESLREQNLWVVTSPLSQ